MSYTPYDDSVPVVQDALTALTKILEKAEQHPNAADLPKARLIGDMHPLTFQVKMCGVVAVRVVARLSGIEPVDFEGELITFADMHARIEQAQELLAQADRDFINGRADEKIMVTVDDSGRRAPSTGYVVIFAYVLPTVFFHVSMAYAILRKEGVPVGKDDFMNSFGERLTRDL